MNKVFIVGRLTRDPELTTTNSGLSVCRFTVAVTRRYANAEGEREADFINCVAWRNLADNIVKYQRKGSQVAVCGSLQTRSYDGQDGTKKYVTEVVCDDCEFLGSKQNAYDGEPTQQSKFDDEPKSSKTSVDTFTPVDDDDLPF